MTSISNGWARARLPCCASARSRWGCGAASSPPFHGYCPPPPRGLRGAVRRLFKGLLPRAALEKLSRKFVSRCIPWEFVDVIEVDPARRVKLRIEYERLAGMHPSDLADILEDLAPAEREAVFTSLDEEVAAETLEEVEPRLQKSLLEKLDEEKIADIVEEM